MRRIPLFPLNTVLYPYMPLRLHIFEERYQLMIQRCIDASEPFGVVLIREGHEVGIAAEPHRVGCLAHITQVQPVGLGRLNLIALGEERFEVQALDYSEPYLSADVELLPVLNAGAARPMVGRLRGWLEQYLDIVAKAENAQLDYTQLPTEPLSFAYLTASLLRLPNEEKQALLEINNAAELVQSLYQVARKEVTLMNIISQYTGTNELPFSTS